MNKKAIFSLLLAGVMTASLMSGCGSEESDNEEELDPNYVGNTELDASLFSDYDYSKFDGQGITLNVANWGEYMAVNDEDYIDVNKTFEALTGIEVNYKTYATNEELYSKLKSGGADYDVVIPSDYMISRMISENMLQKLDYSSIPNFEMIDENYINPEYDPSNEYTVPYMWGVVCIIYNTEMIDEEITGWSALWDEKYKNNILMFNNPRDAFGIALTYLGYSQNTEDEAELRAAADKLTEQKEIVQAYVMDEIFDKMEGGSAAIAPYYAGDAVTMMDENPALSYCLPVEGTNLFADAMCIPVSAKNKEAAQMYINFLCETEIAYSNCDYIGYSTPHKKVYEMLDEEVRSNELQYPSAEYLAKTETFRNLSDETNELTQELWNKMKKSRSASVWLIPIILVLAIIAIIVLNIRRAKKKKEQD